MRRNGRRACFPAFPTLRNRCRRPICRFPGALLLLDLSSAFVLSLCLKRLSRVHGEAFRTQTRKSLYKHLMQCTVSLLLVSSVLFWTSITLTISSTSVNAACLFLRPSQMPLPGIRSRHKSRLILRGLHLPSPATASNKARLSSQPPPILLVLLILAAGLSHPLDSTIAVWRERRMLPSV